MRSISILFAAAVGLTLAMTTADTVHAQGMQGGMAPGMMQRDRAPGAGSSAMPQAGTNQGMMAPGMTQGGMGRGMMCPMMSGMMQGMGQGATGPSMMGQGMMGGGTGGMFGSRVTPMMNLSVDDVRGYLDMQLKRLDNKRLKVGDIKSDDANITADIVTVDNSLVQRLKVNRHTGAIEYES